MNPTRTRRNRPTRRTGWAFAMFLKLSAQDSKDSSGVNTDDKQRTQPMPCPYSPDAVVAAAGPGLHTDGAGGRRRRRGHRAVAPSSCRIPRLRGRRNPSSQIGRHRRRHWGEWGGEWERKQRSIKCGKFFVGGLWGSSRVTFSHLKEKL